MDRNCDEIRGEHGSDARQIELVDRIARLVPVEGVHGTAFEPLALIRSNAPMSCLPAVYDPCLCVVVQGHKRVTLGDETFDYDPLNYLVVSVTLPVIGKIVKATPEQPYLCLRLDIDPREIGRLMLEMGARDVEGAPSSRGLYVASMSGALLDALLRLVRLLDDPSDLPVLAPSATREIWFRLLGGDFGHRLRDLTRADSQVRRIAGAIDRLRTHYDEPIRIDELAGLVHMSPSSLHQRFRAVTAMSPLQFQKQLRLHEARRLMLVEGMEAATAGHRVGYESPSQFSREYRRLFGAPPRRDVRAVAQVVALG